MSNIQALVLSKEHFTSKAKAEKWVNDHHIVKTNYRFRLKEPNENKYNYRMKHLTTGVQAVIEYPKQ